MDKHMVKKWVTTEIQHLGARNDMKSKNVECYHKGKDSFDLWDTHSIIRAVAWETWKAKLHKEDKWSYNSAIALVSMGPQISSWKWLLVLWMLSQRNKMFSCFINKSKTCLNDVWWGRTSRFLYLKTLILPTPHHPHVQMRYRKQFKNNTIHYTV